MRQYRLRARTLIVLTSSLALLALLAPAASGESAAAPSQSNSGGESSVRPMVILGFDENVAALNGFALVTGPDGRLRSVSRDALEGEVGSAAIHGGMRVTEELLTSIEGASTQGQVVGGNCGWSYIYFNRIARLKGSYRTGFQLNEPAISYQWTVGITGPSAGWAKVFGGALAFATSWTSGERTYNAAVPGTYLAGVWTSSHAVLWTGGVCYSGGPTSVATL